MVIDSPNNKEHFIPCAISIRGWEAGSSAGWAAKSAPMGEVGLDRWIRCNGTFSGRPTAFFRVCPHMFAKPFHRELQHNGEESPSPGGTARPASFRNYAGQGGGRFDGPSELPSILPAIGDSGILSSMQPWQCSQVPKHVRLSDKRERN
jgi:hypothetical protein